MRDMHDSDTELDWEANDAETKDRQTRRTSAAYYGGTGGGGDATERYLQLLAALELHLHHYQKQQALVNHQVDLCMFEEAQDS